MEFDLTTLLLLFSVAVVAGWVDTIAGGGGLLTLPAMIMAGLPPAAAIATNKLQGSMGTFIASAYFVRKGVVKLSDMKLMIFMTLGGSVFGSFLLLKIDANALIKVLPILLILVGVYFLFAPNLDDVAKKKKIGLAVFAFTAAPLLGFYDGFFGPGTGSFMALSFVLLCGYGLSNATAHAKVLNFAGNIAALVYFIFYGDIFWLVGTAMMAGQILGATVGAKMVMSKGATLIRPVVVLVCFAMAAKILWQSI